MQVFDFMRENVNTVLRQSFFRTSCRFVQVQPGELKGKALTDFPKPSCRKQMHSFLGLANYFRKFIPTYVHITSAISDMMKKCNEFVWSEAAEKAFLAIKSVLVSRPVLRHLTLNCLSA